jgi:pimeloyl-ACP methyl ester carboxylesterase
VSTSQRPALIAGSSVLLARLLAALRPGVRCEGGVEGLVADELWLVSEGIDAAPRRGRRVDAADARALLEALPALGASELNCVWPDHSADPVLERDVVERCTALGVRWRIVHSPPVVDEQPGASGVLHLLAALDSVRREIEARMPDYFREQPLRCLAPAGVCVDVVRAEAAARRLLRLAARPDTAGRVHHVAASVPIPFASLCEDVGRAYDLELVATDDPRSLNPVDRLFHARLNGFNDLLAGAAERGSCEGDRTLDGGERLALFRSVRRAQEAAARTERTRLRALPRAMKRRSADCAGEPVIYYTAGEGDPPLVVVNALGQGLGFWHRLLDRLARRRRVVIWEPRGVRPSPGASALADQVDDLDAVLSRERITTCDLLCWCTGPRVAVELVRRRPAAVSAMVFLNGSFKQLGVVDGLDTRYEHNVESMLRAVERHPRMAKRLMEVFGSGLSEAEPGPDGVLAMADPALEAERRRPFRTDAALLSYARQMLAFWAHDTMADAPRVRTPVLFVGCENDEVASTARLRGAARHFPTARYAEIAGATHYCLYDRPDLLGGLIEAFLHDPDLACEIDGEVSWPER